MIEITNAQDRARFDQISALGEARGYDPEGPGPTAARIEAAFTAQEIAEVNAILLRAGLEVGTGPAQAGH